MWIAIVTFRLLAFSQVFLTLLALAVSPNPGRIRFWGCLLLLGVGCYLTAPLAHLHVSGSVSQLTSLGGGLVPALLLLFIWSAFEDQTPTPPILWIVCGLYFLLLIYSELSQILAWRLTLQLAKLLLVALAVALIWRGRAADLVERRLRLRTWLAAILAVAVVSVVLVELLATWQVPSFVELMGMIVFFLLAIVLNTLALRSSGSLLLLPNVAPESDLTVEPRADGSREVQRLLETMRNERLYADHDLRIGTLATRMRLPEYQLRKLINGQLGFRNFNQFVNQYRVAEAGERLRSDTQTPVLTIALDVGFRSISSFNSAFKAQQGVSPTQYRSRRLSDS